MTRFLRMLLVVVVVVVVGFLAGSAVNMGFILLGGHLVPPPVGSDVSSMDGLKAAMPLFGPANFVFPFLAHALGAVLGACVAALLAPGRSATLAWVVGGLFFLGGLANVFLLPAPLWFSVLDLVA